MCSVQIEGLKEGRMLHRPHHLCQNSVLVRLYHSQVLELTLPDFSTSEHMASPEVKDVDLSIYLLYHQSS